MAKVFRKLTQTHVRLEAVDPISNEPLAIRVPLLPISSLAEYRACREDLRAAKTLEHFEAVCDRLAALAATVIPAEYAVNLLHLSLDELADLASYLMYGDSDDLPPPEPEAKN